MEVRGFSTLSRTSSHGIGEFNLLHLNLFTCAVVDSVTTLFDTNIFGNRLPSFKTSTIRCHYLFFTGVDKHFEKLVSKCYICSDSSIFNNLTRRCETAN